MLRKILITIFLISVATNVILKIVKNGHEHHWKEVAKLHAYKNVSYKDGHQSFEDAVTKRHPEINLKGKNSIICLWDSTGFDFMHSETMKDMDSLVNVFGKYSFNYIFVTEMDERISNAYLERNEANYENLTVLGGMDDFISSLYCTYPSKHKMIFLGDTTKNKKCVNMMRHQKSKPYYLIMDTAGKIIYHQTNRFLLSKDTTFMRIARSSILVKPLKDL